MTVSLPTVALVPATHTAVVRFPEVGALHEARTVSLPVAVMLPATQAVAVY
jgi:hypothetical protein